MATMYFKTVTGEPFTANAVTGEDGVSKGHCVKVTDAPDDIAEWRMKYNFGTNAVDVYGTTGITDDEAVAKQITDNETEATAETEREKARIAANAG